jgi:hypothetical protein
MKNGRILDWQNWPKPWRCGALGPIRERPSGRRDPYPACFGFARHPLAQLRDVVRRLLSRAVRAIAELGVVTNSRRIRRWNQWSAARGRGWQSFCKRCVKPYSENRRSLGRVAERGEVLGERGATSPAGSRAVRARSNPRLGSCSRTVSRRRRHRRLRRDSDSTGRSPGSS